MRLGKGLPKGGVGFLGEGVSGAVTAPFLIHLGDWEQAWSVAHHSAGGVGFLGEGVSRGVGFLGEGISNLNSRP